MTLYLIKFSSHSHRELAYALVTNTGLADTLTVVVLFLTVFLLRRRILITIFGQGYSYDLTGYNARLCLSTRLELTNFRHSLTAPSTITLLE